MVGQSTNSKASSIGKKAKGEYTFRSIIKADWQLPREPELGHVIENIVGGLNEYSILGKPGGVSANPARWKDPPHRHFVNLPVSTTQELGVEIIEPKAMLAFAKHYGFFPHTDVGAIRKQSFNPERSMDPKDGKSEWVMIAGSSASLAVMSEDIEQYSPETLFELIGQHSQALLKYVWRTGDIQTVEGIANYTAKSLESNIDVNTGQVVICVKDAWTLICMLLLRDQAAGRTAICANPDCPAPYFLRSRKTQKICETGGCVAWAQRNYALKWWRENESKASKGKPKGSEK